METIKLDLMGRRRFEFDEDGVAWHADEIYPVPLPQRLSTVRIVTNDRLLYRDITHVGPVLRRQYWTLGFVALGALLGSIWFPQCWGDWGAFAGCAFFVALIGGWPLLMLILGRRFLLIASAERAICVPMDRKKKKIQRVLEILRERCPADTLRFEKGSR